MIIEIIGLILTIFSSVYLLPQLIKTYKSKQVRDVSKFFTVYNFLVHFAWTIYNIFLFCLNPITLPYLVNSSVRTISAFLLLLMFLKYDKKYPGENNE